MKKKAAKEPKLAKMDGKKKGKMSGALLLRLVGGLLVPFMAILLFISLQTYNGVREDKAQAYSTLIKVVSQNMEATLAQFGETVEIASSKDRNYCYVPKKYEIPTDADYFHITTNNTIYGTEIRRDIDSPVPLIADMSCLYLWWCAEEPRSLGCLFRHCKGRRSWKGVTHNSHNARLSCTH